MPVGPVAADDLKVESLRVHVHASVSQWTPVSEPRSSRTVDTGKGHHRLTGTDVRIGQRIVATSRCQLSDDVDLRWKQRKWDCFHPVARMETSGAVDWEMRVGVWLRKELVALERQSVALGVLDWDNSVDRGVNVQMMVVQSVDAIQHKLEW